LGFSFGLHIAPVLTAYPVQGLGNLSQGTIFDRFHQHFEQVFLMQSGLAQLV
jgi:hypothetical protein